MIKQSGIVDEPATQFVDTLPIVRMWYCRSHKYTTQSTRCLQFPPALRANGITRLLKTKCTRARMPWLLLVCLQKIRLFPN